MKRSEMIESVEFLLNNYHPINLSDHKNMALIIMDHIEDLGMCPPKHPDFKINRVNQWESEDAS